MKTMQFIATAVAIRHGLSVGDIRGPSRKARIVRARQEAFAVIREETRFSYPRIGRFFNRDHSTIIYGLRRHADREVSIHG